MDFSPFPTEAFVKRLRFLATIAIIPESSSESGEFLGVYEFRLSCIQSWMDRDLLILDVKGGIRSLVTRNDDKLRRSRKTLYRSLKAKF